MGTLEHELAWLLDEEVFSVDGEPFSWCDVLAAAELRGAAAEWIEATRQGLAGVAASEPSAEDVREAAARFRYERRLLSADELESWLGRWRLSIADWTAHLRRSLRAGPAQAGVPA